jgi:hypothetical protein
MFRALIRCIIFLKDQQTCRWLLFNKTTFTHSSAFVGLFKHFIQYSLFTLNSAFIVLSHVYRTCHDQIQYLFQI